VPGGVGGVKASVLAGNMIEAAMRASMIPPQQV
jgi:hypothetical protein